MDVTYQSGSLIALGKSCRLALTTMQSDKLPAPHNIETSRPAPLLPGFYSLQTISLDDSRPSITQYHRKPEPAVRWKTKMAKQRLFDAYALCSSESRWDLYDHMGKLTGVKTSITSKAGLFMEQRTHVVVDKDAYEQSVKDVLGNTVCCLTFAEHHAYASSVGHSNMVVIARQLVIDADDEDAEHIYLADSVVNGCRVQGWFMDTSKISSGLMDKYLDRYKWLSNGWPLANDHHAQVLGYRMATMRSNQIHDLMMKVSNATSVGEHQSMMFMRLQHAPTETMAMFAARMMEVIESSILIQAPQALEVFDDDVLLKHADQIAALYKETFL